MKAILILALLCSLPLLASNSTVKEFVFHGQDFERQRIDFKTMKTTYEEQWVDSTCYKQEPYTIQDCGYKQVEEIHYTMTPPTKECKKINGKLVCKVIPGKKIPNTVWVTKYSCDDVTKYHTVSYNCKKKEMVEVYVMGMRYITNLFFRFDGTPLYPELIVRSEMNPEDGSATVTATNIDGSSVLLVAEKNEKVGGNKSVTVRDIEYLVKSFDRDSVLSPVSKRPSDISFFGTWLRFKVGKVYTPQFTKFKLRILDVQTGRVLINRFLKQGEYRIYTSYDDTSRVTVEMRKLGLGVYSWNKYKIKVTSKVEFGEGLEVLNNESEIGKLFTSKTVTVN